MSTLNIKTEKKLNKEIVRKFFGTSHAFIIGINDYEDFPPLKTAVNDALALADALQKYHDYEVYEPLINAKYQEVIDLFTDKIPKTVNENDRVLLYFAGHGISEEKDGKPNDGYLAPADAVNGAYNTLIPFEELYKTLNKLPCKHGLLVMDCCFAGTIKWASQSRDVLFDLPEVVYDKRLEKYAREEAWQVITSAGADQKAKDFLSRGDQEGVPHSPFAAALLKALGEESKADLVPEKNEDGGKGDGLISVTELFVHLKAELGGIGELKDQTPNYFSLHKHGNGEFFFLHPKHPLTLPRAPERCPFVGLKPYTSKESYLYFGRNEEIKILKGLIESHSLVLFSGASGAGKTSLLYGGLLPALETSKVKSWNILPNILKEGSPLEIVRVVLSKMKPKQDNLLLLDDYTRLISGLTPEKLVEFEHFICNISNKVSNLKIIVCGRPEALAKLNGKVFSEIEKRVAYELPDIKIEKVPETIKDICRKLMAQEVLLFKPINHSKSEDDKAEPIWSNNEGITLLDKIVEDLRPASQVLPLYSLVMERLYLEYERGNRDDRELSIEDYENIGGAMGILYKHVQKVFNDLEGEPKKEAMKKVLLRMIAFYGETAELTKIEAWQLEFSDEKENETTQNVIDILLDQRILFSYLDLKGNLFYEMAHPQLLNRIKFLGKWNKNPDALKRQFELREHVRNLAAPIGHLAFHKNVLKPMMRENVKVKDYANFLKGKSGAYAGFWHKKKEKLDPVLGYLISKNHVMSKLEADFVQASADVRVRTRKIRSRFQWGISITMLILTLWALNSARIARIDRQKAENSAEAEKLSAKKAKISAEIATANLDENLYTNFQKIINEGDLLMIKGPQCFRYKKAEEYWKKEIKKDTLVFLKKGVPQANEGPVVYGDSIFKSVEMAELREKKKSAKCKDSTK